MNTARDKRIIYFDNAATTFPKPQSVTNEVLYCMESFCGNAGRGSHMLAMRSAETVYNAREAIASLFSAEPENVIFTLNTTYALNMAIKGVCARGGHILISNMEHNSVLRPIARLAADKKIRYDVFKGYDSKKKLTPKDILSDITSRLRSDTKAIVCIHSSNICSYSLPIREIGQFCRRHGIRFIVDAAQSAGHLPISIADDCIDVLCLPAHKGLYSPQGVGIMILRQGLRIDTLIEGGNGVSSLELGMGDGSPERYEGGTLCLPAIAGLCRGVEFVKQIGIDAIASHEKRLWMRAFERLSSIRGVKIYDRENSGGVMLFNLEGIAPDTLGELLSAKGFCLRTGYHCTALAHKALGTLDGGGVRIGFGMFNTEQEVDALCSEISAITKI